MTLVIDQKIENLASNLDEHFNLFGTSGIKDQILNAYKFETPGALFTLHNKKNAKIDQLITDLNKFFYAGAISFSDKLNKSAPSKLILLSRFKN